jgi:hypothetical protein
MSRCDDCGEPATKRIPTIPGHACEAHAQAFWTGLLNYVREQRSASNEGLDVPGIVVENDPSLAKLRKVTAKASRMPLRRAS